MAEAGPGRLIAGGRSADVGAPVLLHRDLHPQNVILTADGPRIIDWEGAARGPAVADVAMTWVIVGFSDVAGLTSAGVRTVQALFTRSFLAAAGPVDRDWLAAPSGSGSPIPTCCRRNESGWNACASRRGAGGGAPDTGMTRGTGSSGVPTRPRPVLVPHPNEWLPKHGARRPVMS
jgi:hypothetical protein